MAFVASSTSTTTTESRSIYLKAYSCPDGREIHYAAALLRRDPEPDSPTRVLDPDDPPRNEEPFDGPCWVFFYPMGPNRRLLEAVISRYAPRFECDADALFLSVNRPGKGTSSLAHHDDATSTSQSAADHDRGTNLQSPDERKHVRATCDDVRTVLDHYGVREASLMYMCAGATYAYSFAARHPDRTAGFVVGIASWVLRSDTASSSSEVWRPESEDGKAGVATPPAMHGLVHRLAMDGWFGPRWFVSSLAGGFSGSVNGAVFNYLAPETICRAFKGELSEDERRAFDERYPGGAAFVEMMKWIQADGYDGEASAWVNEDHRVGIGDVGAVDANDGDARDCAVCLSTQQDLGLIYQSAVPPQRQILLWHGEEDRMISMKGADYLTSMLPNVTLTRVRGGTHQGTMLFFPEDAMEALNRISRDYSVKRRSGRPSILSN